MKSLHPTNQRNRGNTLGPLQLRGCLCLTVGIERLRYSVYLKVAHGVGRIQGLDVDRGECAADDGHVALAAADRLVRHLQCLGQPRRRRERAAVSCQHDNMTFGAKAQPQ